VKELVIRESIRKKGKFIDVVKPMGQYFKAIEPFSWTSLLQAGIMTPMSTSARAQALICMHLWAIDKDDTKVALPPLVYDELYTALMSIQNALDFEINAKLPSDQRMIPDEVRERYQRILAGDFSDGDGDSVTSMTPSTEHLRVTQNYVEGSDEEEEEDNSLYSNTTPCPVWDTTPPE
jgi:hypothetical protein